MLNRNKIPNEKKIILSVLRVVESLLKKIKKGIPIIVNIIPAKWVVQFQNSSSTDSCINIENRKIKLFKPMIYKLLLGSSGSFSSSSSWSLFCL